MLMTEWNWDDALAVRFEEGWEKGQEKGEQRIIELWKSGKSLEEVLRSMAGK